MIVCKLELWPGGNEENARHLGTIEISNDLITTFGSSGLRGTYSFDIWKKRLGSPWKSGRIREFPRLSYHPWNLVRQILNNAAEKNGGRI